MAASIDWDHVTDPDFDTPDGLDEETINEIRRLRGAAPLAAGATAQRGTMTAAGAPLPIAPTSTQPAAPSPTQTTQPIAPPTPDPTSPPGTSPVSRPSPNSGSGAPTPFQTPDPLAFMPLPIAGGQVTNPTPTPVLKMAPIDQATDANPNAGAEQTYTPEPPPPPPPAYVPPPAPTPVPAPAPMAPPVAPPPSVLSGGASPSFAPPATASDANPNAGASTTNTGTPPKPKQWSYSDPRTQAQILEEDYGGDYNAFVAASPNAAIAALATLPGGASGLVNGEHVQYGSDGSMQNAATGAPISGPNETIASTIAAPFDPKNQHEFTPGTGGVSGVGGNGQPIPGSIESYLQNGVLDVVGPNTPTTTAPPPMPWEQPVTPATIPDLPSTPAASAPSTPSTPSVPPPVLAPLPVAQTPSTPSTSSVPETPTSTPSTPVSPPSATSAPSATTSAPPGATNAVVLTPTTPENSLTNSTITPGPALDRVGQARTLYNDWVQETDPQFQAAMRDANRYSAAAGRIGSGQATNSIGDIQTQRENNIRSKRDEFLGNALNASVEDAWKAIGLAERQQQYQSGERNTAFDQQVTLQRLVDSEAGQAFSQQMAAMGFNANQIQQAFENAMNVARLEDDETGQAFYRAMQQEIYGSQGDPAAYLEWLAGQWARGSAAA